MIHHGAPPPSHVKQPALQAPVESFSAGLVSLTPDKLVLPTFIN